MGVRQPQEGHEQPLMAARLLVAAALAALQPRWLPPLLAGVLGCSGMFPVRFDGLFPRSFCLTLGAF